VIRSQTRSRTAFPSPRLRADAGVLARLAILAVLAVAVAGCASSSVLDNQVKAAPEPPKTAAVAEMDAAGQREHERILAAYNGAYEDPRIEAMVSETVEKLVAASDRPDMHYRITLLNSPVVNAFALPTGNLYVTRGLIALANDRSELASVMAHEMSHVIAHHAEMREDRARTVALVTRMVNDVLSDPEVGAMALAKSKLALGEFSRAQEFEADGMGVGIAAKAGYDPYGAARFLTSLGREGDLRQAAQANIDPRAPDFLSSHPATPERVSNALSVARQLGAPGSGERDRHDYLESIDGMAYGDDPSEGLVRGRRFLHPRLGFAFVAPEGFSLENTPQLVLGVKDGGGQALRLDAVQVPADQASMPRAWTA
jgi:predicted Zn-dependent protease